ncbi:hypothetical protein MTR67_051522 [Solanum verrucosum]|uniref:Uncharacterized protein n=1 Tax=Solanum verrucosum TaxID=315347 RepID=A0AAF0V515_SOLVR|nr:hypothetical protein MTR67_051522 [Solanum verrucosum]
MAQSRQKSYADVRRRDLGFDVHDWVYLKVSHMKGVMRFGLGVDESLSYEEVPFEILDRQVKKLRNKEVASVKVLWRNRLFDGATRRPRPI